MQSHSTAAGHATLRGMSAYCPDHTVRTVASSALSCAINRDKVIAFVALGANLGNAAHTVRIAMQSLAQLPRTQLLISSSLYRSAPLESAGGEYINAVVKISTGLPAYALLKLLQRLEQSAGRERPYRNAPRTLDLDLLLYGESQIQSEPLTVPHPRMWGRAFVLMPLAEIAPTRVSSLQLQAVAAQQCERLHHLAEPLVQSLGCVMACDGQI
jgi:2-amino-4-hydroxy-6-hydroxymethyldihydropteridine diphosphokinase